MSELIPISQVRDEDVYSAARSMLRNGASVQELDEFLVSIDWSGANLARPPVADLVDELQNLLVLLDEDMLVADEFARRLMKLLPAGGEVGFTFAGLPEEPVLLELDQYSQPPQTGSGVRVDQDLIESESDSVLVMSATH